MNIPVTASATATGQGEISAYAESFEIVDPNNATASVTFSAAYNGAQSLFTDIFGVYANSEASFVLTLDNGDTPIFFDNPLTIGPSSSLVQPLSGTVTNSLTLQTNTPYAFDATADAESSGLNVVSEPSTITLAGLGLSVLGGLRLRRRG